MKKRGESRSSIGQKLVWRGKALKNGRGNFPTGETCNDMSASLMFMYITRFTMMIRWPLIAFVGCEFKMCNNSMLYENYPEDLGLKE